MTIVVIKPCWCPYKERHLRGVWDHCQQQHEGVLRITDWHLMKKHMRSLATTETAKAFQHKCKSDEPYERWESLLVYLFQKGPAVTSPHGVSERPVHLLHATHPLWWTKVVIPEAEHGCSSKDEDHEIFKTPQSHAHHFYQEVWRLPHCAIVAPPTCVSSLQTSLMSKDPLPWREWCFKPLVSRQKSVAVPKCHKRSHVRVCQVRGLRLR